MNLKKLLSGLMFLSSVLLNGHASAAIETRYHSFNAAVMHPNGKAYFFRDAQYYRFAFNPDNLEGSGVVNSTGWTGLSPNPDAAVRHPNGKTYFFFGTTYQVFDHAKDKVEGGGRIGIDAWKGVPFFVDSAVNHPNGKVYFFKDDKYYRFDFASNQVDKVGIIGVDGWQGLPLKTTAAILHPNGKAYFFIGNEYYRFDFSTDSVDKIGEMGVAGWAGLTVETEIVDEEQSVSRLINSNSSLCLAVGGGSATPGAAAIQWGCGSAGSAGNPEQEWMITLKADGYEIMNNFTSQCLTVNNGGLDNGSGVIQSPCDGSLLQRWLLPENSLLVINAYTKQCLAIGQADKTTGKAAIQWPCNSSATPHPEQDWLRP